MKDTEEATVKKCKKLDNGLMLQPYNNAYETLVFTEKKFKSIPIQIIGIVKQLKRKF